ncbi:MAG TPA: hypothetical protein VK504_05835 [Vicinamibacterales bacterium]|jgi:hypothetical protein|nr:hypothetical protein [Vicinamibacterales bacterium]
MAIERRQVWLLGLLLAVLTVVAYRAWTSTSATPARTSNEAGAAASSAGRSGQATPQRPAAPDVRLEALDGTRPKPGGGDRNLFRFKPKAPPPAPPVERLPPPVAPVPTGPPPPPPVPPIPLKFIGTLERNGQKIAILSDTTGHVSYGPEGATIDGRYRIIRIGAESIELAYVDGRGRQTIRFTGG